MVISNMQTDRHTYRHHISSSGLQLPLLAIFSDACYKLIHYRSVKLPLC